MKQHVRIYLLGLIALFFISTTGVTVYKHHCSHGGVFYGVFLDVNHECGPEEVEETHDCCITGVDESDFQFTEECCTSDVDFYQIDTDLIGNDAKVNIADYFVSTFSIPVQFSFIEFQNTVFSNKAPPSLNISERLSLLQKYLI